MPRIQDKIDKIKRCVRRLFHRKSDGTNKTGGGVIKSKILLNPKSANELHKAIIRILLKS